MYIYIYIREAAWAGPGSGSSSSGGGAGMQPASRPDGQPAGQASLAGHGGQVSRPAGQPAQYRMSTGVYQRPEARSQRPETRGQRPEAGRQAGRQAVSIVRKPFRDRRCPGWAHR